MTTTETDDAQPPTLVELFEELADRTQRVQDRIRGKNDNFVRKAQKVGTAVATRDVLHDEMMELLKLSAASSLEMAALVDEALDDLDDLKDGMREQSSLLRAVVSGSIFALSLTLAQRVLDPSLKGVDEEMKQLASQIVASIDSAKTQDSSLAGAISTPGSVQLETHENSSTQAVDAGVG